MLQNCKLVSTCIKMDFHVCSEAQTFISEFESCFVNKGCDWPINIFIQETGRNILRSPSEMFKGYYRNVNSVLPEYKHTLILGKPYNSLSYNFSCHLC